MKNYTCIYYTNSSGKAPVKELITSLDEDTQGSFFYKTELLEEYGPKLRKPHTDNIGNSIFELRFVGKEGQIRVLFFFFDDQKIIYTNGFVKKTQKTPLSKIKLAEKRRKEYLQRRR